MSVTGEPEEALQLTELERPHLVLLDLVLSDTDGIDLGGHPSHRQCAGDHPVGLRSGPFDCSGLPVEGRRLHR